MLQIIKSLFSNYNHDLIILDDLLIEPQTTKEFRPLMLLVSVSSNKFSYNELNNLIIKLFPCCFSVFIAKNLSLEDQVILYRSGFNYIFVLDEEKSYLEDCLFKYNNWKLRFNNNSISFKNSPHASNSFNEFKNLPYLKDLLQNIPILLNAVDEDNNFIFWNHECELLTGYNSDEIINNSDALKLLYPEKLYQKRIIDCWTDKKKKIRNCEAILTTKNNEKKVIIWFNITENMKIPGWSHWSYGFDITEFRNTEIALQESDKRYKHLIENAPLGIPC